MAINHFLGLNVNLNELIFLLRILIVNFIFVFLLFLLRIRSYIFSCCLDLDYTLLNSKHFLVRLLFQVNLLNEKYLNLVLINLLCRYSVHFVFDNNEVFHKFFNHLIVNWDIFGNHLIQININFRKKN